jgi:catechol 2,3-dioxygenase-like lactoylglutathione lyase family enzyme
VKDPDGHPIAFVESHHTPAASVSPSAAETGAVSARVLHTGLTIKDPEAADRFYKDVLGFSEIWRGGRAEGVTSWINMKVPNGTDYLEYMLVTGPVSRQQRGVLHHVALLVPDIQLALDTVRNRTPIDERPKLASPQVGRNNRWQLNLYDPDGTRAELMEPFTMR